MVPIPLLFELWQQMLSQLNLGIRTKQAFFLFELLRSKVPATQGKSKRVP